jgi:acetate kinase
VRVLVVNAGSSTLKLTLLGEDDAAIAERELQAPHARVDQQELRAALAGPLGEADAVGHRIVHGGERYREAVRIDADVRAALGALVELAPLHQPKSLAALDAVTEALPEVPVVACFDTAFHATLPTAAATYALPARWRERWRLRRYGFHGLSHAWVARRTPQLLGRETSEQLGPDPPELGTRDRSGLRIVSCHLGAGASLCAIGDGESLDTTMGFTPLEGLVMATRSGSIDPGMLLWLLEHEGLSATELADVLEHRSGLLGLAGSADMHEIVERASAGVSPAVLALDVYTHRLRAGIAAMAAALGGLDALVFTGGVGEHSSEVRTRTATGLAFLGVSLDDARNSETQADGEIGADGAAVRTLVVTAREDLEIARQLRALLTR